MPIRTAGPATGSVGVECDRRSAEPATFLPTVGHLQGRLGQYELLGQHWLGLPVVSRTVLSPIHGLQE